MAQRIDSAKRVINGTYTEVWVDGILKAECTACQAKIAKNKTVIQLCGQFMEDKKATGGSGTGSLTMHKVDSADLEEEQGVLNGIDRRYTIITKVNDPDAYGCERIAFYNCSFDDVTLADHKTATPGTVTRPFTFTRYELLDVIEPN